MKRNRLILESRIYGRKRQLPHRALESIKPQYIQMRDSLLAALESLKLVPKTIASPQEGLVPFLPLEGFKTDRSWLNELKANRWLAVSPGASYETKRAPLELFSESLAQVQKLLLAEDKDDDLGLVFLGDKNDATICSELIASLNWHGPILNLAGQLSLWESAMALNHSVCLLSNDSALGHIAEAVNTPVAVLFGPTVEGFGFAPRKKESRAFSSLLGCRPCSKHGKTPCRFGDKLCFLQISRNEIASHLKNLIST